MYVWMTAADMTSYGIFAVENMELYMVYFGLAVAAIGALAELLYSLALSGVPAENAKDGYRELTKYSHRFSIIVLLLMWVVGTEEINQVIVKSYFCMILIWLAALFIGILYLIIQKIRKKGTSAIGVSGMGKRCVIRSFVAFLMWWIVI